MLLCCTVGQDSQKCKETSRVKFVSHVEKLELRFLQKKVMNYRLSHTFDSEVCYFTQEVLNKKITSLKLCTFS